MVLSTMSFSVFAEEAVTVTTADELTSTMLAGGEVVLGSDINVAKQLEISEGAEVIFYLAGHIVFASIFLAPIGLWWIKVKAREAEELLERAPGILEVNPLEQKKDSMEVSTNEDKEKKEENSLP